jgi:hypothetical protein
MAYYLAFPSEGSLYLDSTVLLTGHFKITVDMVWRGTGDNKLFDSPGSADRFDINIADNGTFDNRNYMSVAVDGVLNQSLQSGVRQTVEIYRNSSHSDQGTKRLQWVGRRYEAIYPELFFYFESDLYGFKVENPTGTITNNYLPTYPDGTGTIWEDSVSGNTARQQDTWPADNSEWVFYAPPVSTPINLSITDILATSARLNWEQG